METKIKRGFWDNANSLRKTILDSGTIILIDSGILIWALLFYNSNDISHVIFLTIIAVINFLIGIEIMRSYRR